MLVYNEAQLQVEFQKLNLKNNVMFNNRPLMKGERVVIEDMIVSNVDGKIYGMWNVCPHRKATFTNKQNDLVAPSKPNAIRCPWHGNEFDVITGEKVSGPSKCNNAEVQELFTSDRLPYFYWDKPIPEEIERLIGQRHFHLCKFTTFVSDYNWKHPVETFAENLHIPYIHPTLKEAVRLKGYKVDNHHWGQIQHVATQDVDEYYGTQPGDVANFVIYDGNFLMEFVGQTLIIQHIIPLAADRSQVDVFYFRCDNKDKPELFSDFLVTLQEDEELTLAKQRGHSIPFIEVDETSESHNLEIGLDMFRSWYNYKVGSNE